MSGVQVERHCAASWASAVGGQAAVPNLHPVALLQLIDTLEPAAAPTRDSDHEPDSDLARVERKLDTLLQLVSLLAPGQVRSHPQICLLLSPTHIRWSDADLAPPPRADEPLLVWLNPLSPAPVQLAGEYQSTDAGGHCIQLSFKDSDFESAWARLLFRWHRRDIARSR